ncbi:signal peptidase I [Enterococcus sp.]|uniref:signal peptidase I n=1 Tax=Enterococcus sp. TaxID=35783 RepID=UPI0028AC99C3|nr:signal peptidase I [Enterococcus sp.]
MRRILKENWFIIFFIIAVVLLRLFVLTPVKVSGHSMDPTLADKQRLIATKLTSYDRQDIVICVEPDDTDKIAVKRLVGLPGDTVEMKDDVLTINGDVYEEPYLDDFKEMFADDQLQEEYSYREMFQEIAASATQFTEDFSITVPDGSYFVMGDNRLISRDSRSFGVVTDDQMEGKVLVRYWPLTEITLF